IQGLAGLNRRLYHGGITYTHGEALQHWNVVQGWSAWALGIVQLLFLVNLVLSLRRGRPAGTNPWEATTLEWQTPSPPAVHNFEVAPTVLRGPYEYSVPGEAFDFTPQNAAGEHPPSPRLWRASVARSTSLRQGYGGQASHVTHG